MRYSRETFAWLSKTHRIYLIRELYFNHLYPLAGYPDTFRNKRHELL